MKSISIRIKRDRPDFRTVIAFLWSDFHNVDTDGDSHNPASRTWTYLYVQNRENESETLEIVHDGSSPDLFTVESDDVRLAARTAWFLAKWCDGKIVDSTEITALDAQRLAGEEFDLDAGMIRARNSIWNKSTLERPYPNLTEDPTDKSNLSPGSAAQAD